MAAYRYVVPALALAGSVAAQSSNSACSAAATTTIQSGGDASALASCQTFSGSIAIATGTMGSIALDGIEEITGSLIANNVTGLTSLSAADLTTITDSFMLDSVTTLSTLNFPMLTEVQTIDWNAIPALSQLTFASSVRMVETLSIMDTGLTSLNGINLATAANIAIANNRFLQTISMQIGNVTQSLSLGTNGGNLDAEFPNLIWANNMTIRNLSTISVPSLNTINGSLGFYGDTFTSFNAPNLTDVGGSLVFVSNGQLTNITLPELTMLGGGLQIANNSQLNNVTFPMLQTVGGAIDMVGSLENVSFPALKVVHGTLTLISTEDVTDSCNVFNGESGPNNVIRGKVTACQGGNPNAKNTTGTPTGSGSGSGTGAATGATPSTSKGAAAGLLLPSTTGLLGLLAIMFGML